MTITKKVTDLLVHPIVMFILGYLIATIMTYDGGGK